MTKGNSLSAVLCFLNFLFFSGHPRASRRRLKFARHSSNVVFEEFVLTSLIASPLIKPLFTPGGWHEVKWVYLKVSVGL